jgi:hypothetical protein
MVIVLCAIISTSALAEDNPVVATSNDAAVEMSADEIRASGTQNGTAATRASLSLPLPPPLPDAPVPHVKTRVIDKKFIVIMAALAGSESFRVTTHQLVLEHEFAAGAPWVASVPPTRHVVVKFGAMYAAELLVAYELKKPHSWLPGDRIIRKFWWAYPAVMAPIHIKNGVRSVRTQAPAGCPPEMCQEQ